MANITVSSVDSFQYIALSQMEWITIATLTDQIFMFGQFNMPIILQSDHRIFVAEILPI